MNDLALILYNRLSKNATDDELDVLEQVRIVTRALKKLGFRVRTGQVDLNFQNTLNFIVKINPGLIFNLVESIHCRGEFVFFPAALYQYLEIPFTGSPLVPLFIAANKVRAKIELKRLGISTPAWFMTDETDRLDREKKYILKPIWEEGSVGLDEHSVFHGNDTNYLLKIKEKNRDFYFIEEFIDGREFNLSIIASPNGPEVLPFAEMTFVDFPEGKPRIMGYTAKWKENSFEYLNTRRTFEMTQFDQKTKNRMERFCKKCWNELGLKGYVRLDFRLDHHGNPYVIDINANPCLSGSGGFMAACRQAGMKPVEAIRRIVEHALGFPLESTKAIRQ